MTRNAMLLVIAGCLALMAFAGVSKALDGRRIRDLRDRATQLRLAAVLADQRAAQLDAQHIQDSIRFADSMAVMTEALITARSRSVRVIQVRDSVRATVDEDTLSAGLRNLLAVEREATLAETDRADLAEAALRLAQARIGELVESQRQLRLQLLTIVAQRDSALNLAGEAIDAASPSFLRDLFQDLPRKAACAAGGAVSAEVAGGKPLLGGAIGLAACLIVEAVIQ